MSNTRFYPTLNGACHLGHLFLALLNVHKAKESGGRFIVRYEYRQSYLDPSVSLGTIERWYQTYREAFSFVGIEAE